MSDCRAVVCIKGEVFRCDMEAPHDGWAHGSTEAQTIWCSDAEAKADASRRATQ